MRKAVAATVILTLAVMGWVFAEAPTQDTPIPRMSEPVIVVPSDGLPDRIEPMKANNNLDVARHEGRVFLAFRTAPNHFAGADVFIYVISSEDQETWEFEAEFHKDTDLREPRLLAWDGRLFLYMAVLGDNPLNFEPQGMLVTERLGAGEWTEPEWFYEKGFIPWRARVIGGRPYMSAYRGGEHIYDFTTEEMEEVFLLTTADGREWEAVVEGKPMVHRGGCSETDFAFLKDGTLVAVCRNELGDADGFGSKICRAEPHALADWECRPDPKKYDSPLVFKHNEVVYLVGRRNLTPTGNFDLGYENLPRQNRAVQFQLDYWRRPKRCSLWVVDPVALEVRFLEDLPSRGDTCFASVAPMSDTEYMLYNYSSPLDGPDLPWNQGQQGPTLIYRLLLSFDE